MVRTSHIALALLRRLVRIAACGAIVAAAGCDTIQQDFADFTETIAPPTPGQAARWAADANDPENQRRGVTLLASADFGGEELYLDLYRLYVQEPSDPLVTAASLRALGRHGASEDAALVAQQLEDPLEQIRLEAAMALQRLHDPEVADQIWRALILDDSPVVRAELAIALGQYPTDPVFQALVAALAEPELTVNLAAAGSLRTLTGQDFGDDPREWIRWYETTDVPFARAEPYLYPTYSRRITIGERLVFWNPRRWEKPSQPAGLRDETRSTYDDSAGGGTDDEPAIGGSDGAGTRSTYGDEDDEPATGNTGAATGGEDG